MTDITITRRHALGLGLGVAAAFCLPWNGVARAAARADAPALPVPPLIEPDRNGVVKLRLGKGRHAFRVGSEAASAGVNGSYLGPLLRLENGARVTLAVENALGEETTMHWHGLFVPSRLDGGPHNIIKPGETWSPEVTIDQPPSFNWFHPHMHGDTARQAHMGLAGLIVVTDGKDRERGLPQSYGIDDLPLVLQDRRVVEGEDVYAPDLMDLIHGFRGDILIVNGVEGPVAAVPKGIVRLRLLNGANARNFHLRLSDGRPLQVFASDGGFVAAPGPVDRLTVAPGERYECLVDFSNGSAVDLLTLADDEDTGEELHVMRFVPDAGLPVAVTAIPARLEDPGMPDPSLSIRRRSFVFDERLAANMALMTAPSGQMESGHDMAGMHSGHDMGSTEMEGMHDMDHSMHQGRSAGDAGAPVAALASGVRMAMAGEPFDMNRIDVEVKLGSFEIWELQTQEMAHPFHIHGASFRILTKNGEPPLPHEAGWKDVALIDGRAELLIRFDREADRDHPFMFHCHILEHEDVGMMAQFVTV